MLHSMKACDRSQLLTRPFNSLNLYHKATKAQGSAVGRCQCAVQGRETDGLNRFKVLIKDQNGKGTELGMIRAGLVDWKLTSVTLILN